MEVGAGIALVILALALAYAIIVAGNALRDAMQDRTDEHGERGELEAGDAGGDGAHEDLL